jgi:hypothetical protein
VSEPEFELEAVDEPFVEPYLPEATDVEALEVSEPSNTAPGAVSRRFFNEDGSEKPVPEFRSEEAYGSWLENWGRQVGEQEAARGPDASGMPDGGPQSFQEQLADEQVFVDAAQARALQEGQEALTARVAAAGRAPGVNVRDADAIGAVVGEVQTQVNAWAHDQLGRGVSQRQLAEAVQGYEFQVWLDERIQQGLVQQRYLFDTRNTAMRRHEAQRMQVEAADYAIGLRSTPPQTTVERHWATLGPIWAEMSKRSARLAEQRAALEGIVQRNRQQAAWRPRSVPTSRKLIN